MKYAPMLASPLEAGFVPAPGDWAIEEKFDGHRVLVEVTSHPAGLRNMVAAWSRPRKGKEALRRDLPDHVAQALSVLPMGWYDGELMVNGKATDVRRKDKQHEAFFVLFDVLEVEAHGALTHESYAVRREILVDIADRLSIRDHDDPKAGAVRLAHSQVVQSLENVTAFCEDVWKREGEGAILKRLAAPYASGRRTRDFVKLKALRTAVLTVTGFQPSRGTVRFPGHPFAIICLRDDDGNETTVKAKDDFELGRLSEACIGRKLRIEFQERTTDGGYRHPRWDRWEDE